MFLNRLISASSIRCTTRLFYTFNLDSSEERRFDTQHSSQLLKPEILLTAVQDIGIQFYCGVPDSLLKDFLTCLNRCITPENHVTTVNEGQAVALAAGYHLATRKIPLVYLQNSGLGSIIDPLMSLATPGVYSLPILLLIGWRGKPGEQDEPHHSVQGPATPHILNSLNIPFEPLVRSVDAVRQAVYTAYMHMSTKSGPYALLLSKDTLLPLKSLKTIDNERDSVSMTREQAIKCVVDCLPDDAIIVASTGKLARELFDYRTTKGCGHHRDFLNVGSMGYASGIAFGIALQKPHRQVFCFDGDGAALMHMGSLATFGSFRAKNFKHIIFNNGRHDSTGGQYTAAMNTDRFSFQKIARGCGYREARTVATLSELKQHIESALVQNGPLLLDVRVAPGARDNLSRPSQTLKQLKNDFMHSVCSNS